MALTYWCHLGTADPVENSPTRTVISTANCGSLRRGLGAWLGLKVPREKGKLVVCRLEMPQVIGIDLKRSLWEEKLDQPLLQLVDQGRDSASEKEFVDTSAHRITAEQVVRLYNQTPCHHIFACNGFVF